jgi:hypothetical protein
LNPSGDVGGTTADPCAPEPERPPPNGDAAASGGRAHELAVALYDATVDEHGAHVTGRRLKDERSRSVDVRMLPGARSTHEDQVGALAGRLVVGARL